ncbi:MAG: helix-turn-helix domain-containing protein [Candidatus Tectimicrobiota bacterium]
MPDMTPRRSTPPFQSAPQRSTPPPQGTPRRSTPPPRKPGRPKHSITIAPEHLAREYQDAYRFLYTLRGYTPSREDVAEELHVSERTLRRWLAEYHLTWPPVVPRSAEA